MRLAVLLIGIAAFKYIFDIPTEYFFTAGTYLFWSVLIIGGLFVVLYFIKEIMLFVVPPILYVWFIGVDATGNSIKTFGEAWGAWVLILLSIGLGVGLKDKIKAKRHKEKLATQDSPNLDTTNEDE